MSNNVTIIKEHTFGQCSALQNISLPDGLTAIGDYAFDGCRSLATITIPKSVISIGYCAFEYCPQNLIFKFNGTMQEWNNIQKYSGWAAGVYIYTVACDNGTMDQSGNVLVRYNQ